MSGLKRHLEGKHPTASLPSPSTSQHKILTFPAKPVRQAHSDRITDLVADVIADCMLPVSTVDSQLFLNLMNYLESMYKLPCSKQ